MEIQIRGLDAVIAKLDKRSNNVQKDVQAALNDFADRVVTDAKSLVSQNSSDEGRLLNSIGSKYGNMNVTIFANTEYAAYIEFGTRKFAAQYVSTLPADWQQLAASTKGKSKGTFVEFVNRLRKWAERTGKMDPKYAYVAAKKILREGVKARPFLYPSVVKNLPLLEQDLKDI